MTIYVSKCNAESALFSLFAGPSNRPLRFPFSPALGFVLPGCGALLEFLPVDVLKRVNQLTNAQIKFAIMLKSNLQLCGWPTVERACGSGSSMSVSNTMHTRLAPPCTLGCSKKLRADMEGGGERAAGEAGDRNDSRDVPAGVKLPPAERGMQKREACGGG